MKIGIDVSQLAYQNTGVANFLSSLVQELIRTDQRNTYILFYSSLRKEFPISNFQFLNKSEFSNVQIITKKLPPTILDFLWNKLHIIPIENFIGDVDVFITSDWTEPPAKKAKKITILYDLIVYKFPNETAEKIVDVQKRKLRWVKKETDKILCISEATAKDALEILKVPKEKVEVIGAGI